MALKNMIARLKKRKDAGFGIVDAVVGVGLAAIIVGGPMLYFATVNKAASGNAAMEGKNTSVSQALDRAVSNVQTSDEILYASGSELVTRSTDPDANTPVITRWIVNGDTLYQQAWTGDAAVASYSRSTKPSGESNASNISTRIAVAGLELEGPMFSYKDRDQKFIDVTSSGYWGLTQSPRTNPDDGRTTYDIALVNMAIKAGSSAGGTVENETSVAPRSVSGKAGAVPVMAPCPKLSVGTDTSGRAVVTFTPMAGYTSYQVYRNTTKATVATTKASDTSKSWTDTASSPAAGTVINYTVMALNPDGSNASLSCTPATWSPPIPAAEFKGSKVMPAADEAPEWTTGTDGALKLKKPRIELNWSASAGAQSYTLVYRELDPATKKPLSTGFTKVATEIKPAETSFTWDGGGWASLYEWRLDTYAGTATSSSQTVMTLTHPPAPQGVTITPEYGTGSDLLTHGKNVITWDPAPTASAYDIWKYNSGSSGSVTKLATVSSSKTTYSAREPYGTEVTYYVAAVNNGPRGTSADIKASSANPEAGVVGITSTMPGVSYREPAGGAPAVSTLAFADSNQTVEFERAGSNAKDAAAPTPVKQLQFPPVPVIDSDKSRDYDGYNQLVWDPVLSAVGYHVFRYDYGTGASKCLTSYCAPANGTAGKYGGTASTTLKDGETTPLKQGSKYNYAAQAYNATGISVAVSKIEGETQRPAAPTLQVSRKPSLVDNSADFEVTQNADAGNTSSNKFCTTDTCEYQLKKTVKSNVSTVATAKHSQSSSVARILEADSPEGSTTEFKARSKNEARTNGGYSDYTTANVDTYPGNFGVSQWLGDKDARSAQRFMATVTNADLTGSTQAIGTAGQTTMAWATSNGAASMEIKRIPVRNEKTSTDGSLGLPAPGGMSYTQDHGTKGVWSGWAAPGATYKHQVTATGANGLERTVTTEEVITPADLPKHATVIITCSNNTYTNQTTARYPQPNHYIGARMTGLEKSSRYGAWGGTSVWGLSKFNGNSKYSVTSARWFETSESAATVNAGDGVPYYYGATAGFEIQNAGKDGGPSSASIVVTNTAFATFNSGCSDAGDRGDKMKEPTWPCYGYTPGEPCKDVNPENRPQWRTR